MSKIALSPNPSGTGTLTISAPNTNSDRTLNLPDSAGTIATAESTLAQFNASGSAPVYACRAWVSFTGNATPPTIRASGNVSSVTRPGTGSFIVNFTTAMPDANYSYTFGGSINRRLQLADTGASATTSSITVFSQDNANNAINAEMFNVAIFR